MNPDQGTELRSGKVIHSSSGTSSPIDSDMAQSSANDSDNNETSDISSQLSEIKENYERKINELQSEFSQLKNLLMAVISKNDENNLPSTTQSSSKPTHRVGFDKTFKNQSKKSQNMRRLDVRIEAASPKKKNLFTNMTMPNLVKNEVIFSRCILLENERDCYTYSFLSDRMYT